MDETIVKQEILDLKNRIIDLEDQIKDLQSQQLETGSNLSLIHI